MGLQNSSLFQLVSKRLSWLSQRQQIISKNLAHAEVPGEKAYDVKPFKDMLQKSSVKRAAMRVTNPKHIVPQGSRASAAQPVKASAEVGTISGNTIDAEGEMQKMNETTTDYLATTNVYRKQVAIYRILLGG